MKHCALLTMDDLSDFECYDQLLHQPLNDLGWRVSDISWRDQSVNWNQFDAVIVRSPWDYQEDMPAFVETLENIERSSALLANPLELQLWNINKSYLKELEEKGCKIVPTLWYKDFSNDLIKNSFHHFNCEELIIKPCISAGASDTFWLKKDKTIDYQMLKQLFTQRDFMLQPFIAEILDPGEFSIFYFNGDYSHCILKTPKTNDFRVQEEYGGKLTLIKPTKGLLESAEQVLNKLPSKTLYARLDFVKSKNDYLLMEAELIEPSLYFNMDNQSAMRFAKAFNNYFNEASTEK